MINKTLRFETNSLRLEIYVEIRKKDFHEGQLDTELQSITGPYNELSIMMGSWDRVRAGGKWHEGSFGQGIDTVEAFAKTRKDDLRKDLERLCAIWREWHLGGMQAGTALQTAHVEAGRKSGEVTNYPDFYGQACSYLEAAGLLNDRGYKYGSKWLVKSLPTAVCSEVIAICERLAK